MIDYEIDFEASYHELRAWVLNEGYEFGLLPNLVMEKEPLDEEPELECEISRLNAEAVALCDESTRIRNEVDLFRLKSYFLYEEGWRCKEKAVGLEKDEGILVLHVFEVYEVPF